MGMGPAALAIVLSITAIADAKDSFTHRPCARVGATDMEASGGANVSQLPNSISRLPVPAVLARRSPQS